MTWKSRDRAGITRRHAYQCYSIRYSRALRWLFILLGLGPRFSRVELDDDELRVRMGWAMRARIPRTAVVAAGPSRPIWWAIGVHGDFRGRWLVNGAPSGIAWLRLDPRARGRVMGLPVKLRNLGLGLEDREGFLAALAAPRTGGPR